ncbi:putative membrane protein [Synechococcus sp. A18-46.1]|nr:putative membrane protein [Synechococcus sp. A18-46.1]
MTKDSDKEEKMLNELLLTTTLCVAIVGTMALFYGELELLLHDH